MQYSRSMYHDKIKYYLYALLILLNLYGQEKEQDEKTSFLWGLIKFDNKTDYEDGYWINKWIFNQEFSSPINRIPVEVRYGIGFDGKTAGSFLNIDTNSFVQDQSKIKYEENVEERINQRWENIFGSSIEIDFGLINIPYYMTGTSWMNVMTGLSYRQSNLFYPAKIPVDDWALDSVDWNKPAYFSPNLREYMLTTHIQYQPFSTWYLNLRYSYGLANAKFYSSLEENKPQDNPKGKGTSVSGAIGLRYILDPGKLNRFTVGFDIRRSYTKIHTIIDPDEQTPINSFVLPNWGVYFTLSAFYGGKKTSGDIAKAQYYKKEYIGSLKTFKTFISEYPSHANRYRADEYIAECEHKIPYQIMEKGIEFEKKYKTQKALEKYMLAKSLVKNDSIIYRKLNKRINQIAILWLVEAETFLNKGNYYQAYNLVKVVAEFSERGQRELRRFKSWVVLSEGKAYQQAGFIGKAMKTYSEALKLNADLIYEVKSLQYKAGIQMANLANKADEFEEIQLAIYSLEYARDLSGGIGSRNEKLLVQLKSKLESLDQYKTRLLIDKKMNIGRIKQEVAHSEKLKIGQTVPQVQELLGEPHEKIFRGEGENTKEQLWVYFMLNKTLQLTFDDYQLFKIEEL